MKGHIQSGVYIILIVLLLFTQGAFAANIALQKVGNHTIKTTVIHRGYPANKGRTASHSFQVDQLIYLNRKIQVVVTIICTLAMALDTVACKEMASGMLIVTTAAMAPTNALLIAIWRRIVSAHFPK